MSQPLSLKYRPAKFEDLVGQRLNGVVLHQMAQTGNVPPGLLFSGPSGIGKTTAARLLAASLDSPDTIEMDAASNGGVAEMRSLIETLRYSTGGTYRVVIIDEAHSLSRDAFNALLKTLEEPPAGSVFVLVTTEPYKIPRTVMSRLMEFQFRAISAPEVLERIAHIAKAESIDITRELLFQLAQDSGGDLRSAIMSLDQIHRAGLTTVEEYLELTGEADTGPELLAMLAAGDHARIFQTLDRLLTSTSSPAQVSTDLIAVLRDLFILRAGGSLERSGQALEIRKELARRLEPERLLAALRILWELKTRYRGAEDPSASLSLALILITEAFTRGKNLPTPAPTAVAEAPAESEPPQRLTLAQMRERKS